MIDIHNLTKRFGPKVAVNDLSMSVPEGEVFAFLGPNGAGKTTTIKVMVGLLRPDAGAVHIRGHDIVTDHVAAKAQISYVPDQPYLYDKLSGREFLDFVGRMYGIPRPVHRRRLDELIRMFELAEYLDDLCERYSHGMKQRVVICAALLHDPAVMIVDEPMVGLDPKSGRLLKDILRERSSQGTTVFMSTHTLAVAEECADRIGIIHHGALIALGTVADLNEMAHRPEGAGLEEVFLQLTAEEEPATAARPR